MNERVKQNLIYMGIALFLLILCGYLSSLDTETSLTAEFISLLISIVYMLMVMAWGVAVFLRITHKNVRNNLLLIASLMLFWIYLRSVKYRYAPPGSPYERILWYMYYIPLILIPLFSLYSAVSLKRYTTKPFDRRWYFMLLPALVLIAGILTNDYHFLAFSFTFTPADTDHYSYGILYFLSVAWIVLLDLSTLLILFRHPVNERSRKGSPVPFVILSMGLIYVFLYALGLRSFIGIRFELTPVVCFFIISVFESCIQLGLIPSNIRYGEFFDASSIAAQITDENGRQFLISSSASQLSPAAFAMLKEARRMPSEDANRELILSDISGGYVIHEDDLRELKSLNGELERISRELKDETELMQNELEARSRALRIRERSRLYDMISRVVNPKLLRIEYLLSFISNPNYPVRGEEKQVILSRIVILGTYIKRRCNLMLMAENTRTIPGDELIRTYREAFENLEIIGITGICFIDAEQSFNIDHAILCFDLFEELLEKKINDLRSVFVYHTLERQFSLRFESPEAIDGSTLPAELTAALSEAGAKLLFTQEEDEVCLVNVTFAEKEVKV